MIKYVCGWVGFLCLFLNTGRLDAEETVLQRKVAAARKGLSSMVSFLDDKAKHEKLAKLYAEHAELKAKAHAWLFGNDGYPIPAKAQTGWVPGKDTQPGHDEMEKRVSLLIVKHNELITALTGALRSKSEVAGERKMTTDPLTTNIPKVHQYGILSATGGMGCFLTDYAKKYEAYAKARAEWLAAKEAETDATRERPLLKALGELSLGRYAEAHAAGAGLTELEKGFFWHACAYHLIEWNRKNLGGHTPLELEATELINVYRIALGIRPLAQHPQLHEMAKDYVQEMDKLKFFGHVHPSDPSRKTFGDRAKRVGYQGVDGENVAGGKGGAHAVWMWRADAGHHRGMINPGSNEIGIGSTSNTVLNTGRGAQMPVTRLFAGEK